ncbi:MAG: stage III sporulation protein AE [Lachnospiraceae bacterium]|nr:stage III sporulation protein AE [Lachnospiraceae bacterium]
MRENRVKKKTGIRFLCMIMIIIKLFCNPYFLLTCRASEVQTINGMDYVDSTGNLMEKLEFDQIDNQLQELFPDYHMNFSELVKQIISGETKLNINLIIELLKQGVGGNAGEAKKIGISIVSLGIVAALFSRFSMIFKNHQIADISFYFLYMLFILILLMTFKEAVVIASNTIENIILFMKILIPTFFMIVGFTTATASAVVFYQFMFVIITLVESIIAMIILPATLGFVFLTLMNGLSEEERLTPLVELIRKGIEKSLALIIGFVGGVGFFQSMITPVIDSVKAITMQKTVAAIPGIGGVADSVTEIVLGSAILIKNSAGLAFVILLLGICAVPLIHIGLMALALKISAAMIGIVTDKRMTNCASQVGDGTMLLLRIVATVMILFIITIAIIIAATNRGM